MNWSWATIYWIDKYSILCDLFSVFFCHAKSSILLSSSSSSSIIIINTICVNPNSMAKYVDIFTERNIDFVVCNVHLCLHFEMTFRKINVGKKWFESAVKETAHIVTARTYEEMRQFVFWWLLAFRMCAFHQYTDSNSSIYVIALTYCCWASQRNDCKSWQNGFQSHICLHRQHKTIKKTMKTKWVEKYRSKIHMYTVYIWRCKYWRLTTLPHTVRRPKRAKCALSFQHERKTKLDFSRDFLFYFVPNMIPNRVCSIYHCNGGRCTLAWRVAAHAAYAAICKQIRKPTKNLLFFLFISIRHESGARWTMWRGETKKSITKMHIYLALHCERIELTCIY